MFIVLFLLFKLLKEQIYLFLFETSPTPYLILSIHLVSSISDCDPSADLCRACNRYHREWAIILAWKRTITYLKLVASAKRRNGKWKVKSAYDISGVERGNLRITQHNTGKSPVRARTQTACSRGERTNPESTAPPRQSKGSVIKLALAVSILNLLCLSKIEAFWVKGLETLNLIKSLSLTFLHNSFTPVLLVSQTRVRLHFFQT